MEIGFWRDNLIYGTSTLLSGVFNYFFSVLLAHGLGPVRFGTVVTVLNVTSVLFTLIPVVNLIATRVGRPSSGVERWWWGLGLGFWGGMWAAGGWLSASLGVPRLLLVLFGAAVVPGLATAANLGYLQRERRYLAVGVLASADAGLGLIAVVLSLSYPHALTVLGLMLNGLAWLLWAASAKLAGAVGHGAEPIPLLRVMLGTFYVGVLTQSWQIADGIAAKSGLGPVAAGRYNGLATIGHSLPFVAASLAMVMLTAILNDPAKTRRHVGRTLAVYALMAGMAEAIFWALPGPLVQIVLGSGYRPVVTLMASYGLGMVALGILEIVSAYVVATRNWTLAIPAGLGTAWWCWDVFHTHNLAQMAHTTAGALAATAAVSLGGLALAVARRGEPD